MTVATADPRLSPYETHGTPVDDTYTVPRLRQIAARIGVRGRGTMSKGELITALNTLQEQGPLRMAWQWLRGADDITADPMAGADADRVRAWTSTGLVAAELTAVQRRYTRARRRWKLECSEIGLVSTSLHARRWEQPVDAVGHLCRQSGTLFRIVDPSELHTDDPAPVGSVNGFGRVKVRCGHYIAASEARCGFVRCEFCASGRSLPGGK